MSSKNEKKVNADQKESSTGILKPLAAAFFATTPEDDDKLLTPKPATKKAMPRPVMKDPEPLLGELSIEEARALLKEQLVGRISEEFDIRKDVPKKSGTKETTEKNTVSDEKEPAKKQTSELAEKPVAVLKEDPAKKVEKKTEKKTENAAKEKAVKPEETGNKTKKTPVKNVPKETVLPEVSVREEIFIEYANQSYDMDELVKKAVQVWTSVYKRSRRELWSVELYVKPQEKKAYYVLNKRKNGSIDL